MEKVLSSTLSGEQFVAHVNDRAEHLFGLHFKRSEFEEWLQWDVIPKMCRGKNAGQHTYSRSRIARIQHFAAWLQAAQSAARDCYGFALLLNRRAHRPHASQCGLAIGPGRIVVNFCGTFRYCGQHRVAMRDGFITGKLNVPTDRAGWVDLLTHANRDSVTE